MPDITMCEGGDCPFKEKCYRYTAKPNKVWQSYMIPPFTVENGKPDCKMFWGEAANQLYVTLTEIMGNKKKKKPTSSSKPKSR